MKKLVVLILLCLVQPKAFSQSDGSGKADVIVLSIHRLVKTTLNTGRPVEDDVMRSARAGAWAGLAQLVSMNSELFQYSNIATQESTVNGLHGAFTVSGEGYIDTYGHVSRIVASELYLNGWNDMTVVFEVRRELEGWISGEVYAPHIEDHQNGYAIAGIREGTTPLARVQTQDERFYLLPQKVSLRPGHRYTIDAYSLSVVLVRATQTGWSAPEWRIHFEIPNVTVDFSRVPLIDFVGPPAPVPVRIP